MPPDHKIPKSTIEQGLPVGNIVGVQTTKLTFFFKLQQVVDGGYIRFAGRRQKMNYSARLMKRDMFESACTRLHFVGEGDKT